MATNAAPSGTHKPQLLASVDEPEVESNGLPPPRPSPFCEDDVVVVEDEAVFVVALDFNVVDEKNVGPEVLVGRVEVSDGGTIVMLVVVAVTVDCCIGLVGTVVVVGPGIMLKEPMVRDVVRAGVVVTTGGGGDSVDVCRVGVAVALVVVVVVVLVLVLGDRVTEFRKQACMIRIPCWAADKTEPAAASTLAQLSSTWSSIDLIPDRQAVEHRCPDVKSAVVQPSIAAW